MVATILLPLSFLCLALLVYAQSSNLLGDLPLAVKTPYLHSWILSKNQKAPGGVWPHNFMQNKVLGWYGMIRVDGRPYQWLGGATGFEFGNDSTTVASTITPTRTTFTIQTGPIKFNATFFSPIEPTDYTRQSIPFAYLFIDGFTANDTMTHTIQLYSDITAEWVTNELTTPVIWDTNVSTDMIYHHVRPTNPQQMVEINNIAEDSTAYYATLKRSGLTWQTGTETDCRGGFSKNGHLTNTKDTAFRAVNDSWPLFCFAIDLGPVDTNNQPDPVVLTLGIVRNPLVDYSTESGFEPRTAYYWSSYQNIDDVISDFLRDFTGARTRGQTLDDSIIRVTSAVSSEYTGVVSLVTRQVFASMDITIHASEGGQPNASDVKIFMKDISVSSRANPVEVIYAALPALFYFNSSFVHDLLVPLLEFQSSSSYPNSYASPDLGSRYPTITGNISVTEDLAIENCGNMLIMSYAYTAKSGDPSLIYQYHPLLQKWANYLIKTSLVTDNAVSADGFGYPDMSNLALKGILGIYSMGKIDEVINPSNTTYKDKANELLTQWKQFAVTNTHIQAQYGKPGTWGLMYNLFPAVWLQTGLIDDDLLKREAQFYSSKAPPGDQSYSLDSQSGNGLAYPHWALMTAAIIPSDMTSVRDALIKSTYHQAYNRTRNFPMPMRYTASTGVANLGTIGSAAHGASFAILAMTIKNVNLSPSGRSDPDAAKKSPLGALVGGVIGGLAFLLVIASVIFLWRRCGARQSSLVIDKCNENNSRLMPFLSQYGSANGNDNVHQSHKPKPLADLESSAPPVLLGPSKSEPDSSGRNHHQLPGATTPPVPPFQPISTEQREALQQSQRHLFQPSESAIPSLTNSYPATGSRGEEVLRAEVDELRREVEAIRDIAQPPPSYR